MRPISRYIAVFGVFLLPFLAAAQDLSLEDLAEGPDDNGFIIGLLEDRLSTDSREIRLSGVEGALSSEATVRRITISDPEGIWLQIDNAVIDWNRAALLRGRLEIDTLAAERIAIPRRPVSEPGLPDPEPRSFAVPELPVAVILQTLEIDRIVLGEPVVGIAAELSASGFLRLAGGELESGLQITRLDAPGGQFDLSASFDNETRELGLDLVVSEPPDGIFANLLGIEGRPAIETSIQASGTVDDLTAQVDLRADGQDLLDGQVTVAQDEGGRLIGVDVTGRLQPLVSEPFDPFFSAESTLQAQARQLDEGGFVLESFELDSGGLRATGSLRTTADGFPEDLELSVDLGDPQGDRLVLPVPGGRTTVAGGALRLSFGDGTDWTGAMRLDGFRADDLRLDEVTLDMSGRAGDLQDPEARHVAGRIEGGARGISAADPGLEAALGDAIELLAEFDWSAGQPVEVATARIEAEAMRVSYQGSLAGTELRGAATLLIDELGVFAGLAERDLAGSIDATAIGTVDPLTGAFDLTLDGSAQGLRLGIEPLDPLLAGETVLWGRLARDEQGLRAEDFRLGNDRVEITADGLYAREDTDFTLAAAIDDIGRVTDAGSGAVRLTAQATGGVEELSLDAALRMDSGRLQDRTLKDGRLAVEATGRSLRDLSGQVDGSAVLGGTAIDIGAAFELREGAQFLRGLVLEAGATRLEGSIARGVDGLLAGAVEMTSPDIAEVASLALMDASGAIDVELEFSRDAGQQRLGVTGDASSLAAAGVQVGRAQADLTIGDLFGIPLADGDLTASDVVAGGLDIDSVSLQAERLDARMALSAEAGLANGTQATLAGEIRNLQPGIRLDLNRLRLDTGTGEAVLTEPAQLVYRDAELRLSPLRLRAGEGMLAAQGRFADTLSLMVELQEMPLALANGILPELELAGVLSGEAEIGGTPEAPEGDFALSGEGLSAAPARAMGLPPLSLEIDGQVADRTVSVAGRAQSGTALDVALNGRVPLDPGARTLELTVLLRSLSLELLNEVIEGQDLGGTVQGSATVGGAVDDPQVAFSLTGENLSAASLAQTGVSAMNAEVSGGYEDGALDIESLALRGPANLRFDASGRVPLQGAGLDVTAEGRVPLALANIPLAGAGAQLAGFLDVSARATGRLNEPDLSGQGQISGATFVSAPLNLRIENLNLQARFAGNRVIIDEAGGTLPRGGRVELDGSIGIDPAARFPADLRLALRDAAYTDGRLLTTRITGDLSLTGPVLGQGGQVGGEVTLERTEILIPSRFGINEGVLLDLRHINPPRDVVLTLDRSGLGRTDDGQSRQTGLSLDVLVRAPDRLFIRGRGLDAEMGGEVRIRGTLSDVVPIGQIDLIRGRLGILGRRIDFDQGSVTLVGDLDPRISLSATVEAGEGVTITLTVAGRASDPQITFASSPDLPQDEILALLVFDRGVADLTPFQVLQLASAAATLAGGGGGGAVDSLRSAIGLANLDVTTDEEGEVGVRAGAYLSENIYLDVEAGASGDTRATINLDITDSIRGKASIDNYGESTIGVFFERDY